jgi:hypothetical protein
VGRTEPYLTSVASLLWPEPATPRAGHRRERVPTPDTAYVVVPSAARPKLLVPRRPRRVAAAAVRNFKTAARGREQLQLRTLAAAFRLGAHDLLADRIVVGRPAGADPAGIDAHLSDVLGRRVFVSLYIGPPRAVRKPVLQVMDAKGRTVGFAKLGVDAFTRDLVRAEAAAVQRLAASRFHTLRVPTVLHAGQWRGHEVLVQSALPRGQSAEPGDPRLLRAMRELAGVGGPTTGPLRPSSYWQRLTDTVAALPPSPMAEVLGGAVPLVAAAAGEAELSYGAAHGDWAPWNMTVAGEHVLVWDWEKFADDVPVGFDAVHHAVQGSVVLHGRSPIEAFEAALARPDEVSGRPTGGPHAGRLIVWLYALDIATRYLVDREEEAGSTRLGDLPSWLPQVLDVLNRGLTRDPGRVGR